MRDRDSIRYMVWTNSIKKKVYLIPTSLTLLYGWGWYDVVVRASGPNGSNASEHNEKSYDN